MVIFRSRRRTRVAAVVVLLSFIAAACGGDDTDDAVPAGTGTEASSGAAPTTGAASCTGEPIKLTAIAAFSGPLAFGTDEAQISNGIDAALGAVNAECTTGRPIEIDVCDDRSDPNESTACGRDAATSGSLALFSSVGLVDNGATAAALPGILTAGNTLFDLTNELSYPSSSGLTLVLGSVSAAAASGVENYLMVALDSAASRFFVGVCQQIAEQLGVTMDVLFFPAETTDFAPVAAQVAERDPDAIGLVVSTMVPFVNALAGEGISPEDVPIFTSVALMPPEVIRELGEKVEGAYLITQQTPPSDRDNPGIEQMLSEFEAAGLDVDDADLGPTAVYYWSNVHILADILGSLSPEEIASLDSASLAAAVAAAPPIDRPEIAPIDFSAPAFGDIEALASFRLFSREAMVVRVEDGEYVPVSSFGDVTVPFELDN
jgi:ABC-type branched-subunit amino acid transport system substrate-binding protein